MQTGRPLSLHSILRCMQMWILSTQMRTHGCCQRSRRCQRTRVRTGFSRGQNRCGRRTHCFPFFILAMSLRCAERRFWDLNGLVTTTTARISMILCSRHRRENTVRDILRKFYFMHTEQEETGQKSRRHSCTRRILSVWALRMTRFANVRLLDGGFVPRWRWRQRRALPIQCTVCRIRRLSALSFPQRTTQKC